MPELTVDSFPVEKLHPYYRNPRRGDVTEIAASLRRRGQYRPIVVNVGSKTGRPYEILAGNHTWAAARSLGWESIQATTVDVDNDAAAQIVVADNRLADLGEYDDADLVEILSSISDLSGTGYSPDDLARLTQAPDAEERPTLVDRFGAAPLSVLSARGGEWQKRKREWLSLGLRSELGRDDDLVFDSPQAKYLNWYDVKNRAESAAGHSLSSDEIIREHSSELRQASGGGTSVFDPALCELLIGWHSGIGQRIIDPWAGGAVRGIVAGAMGRDYVGIELRPEQVEANRAQLPLVNSAVRAGFGVGGSAVDWAAGIDALGEIGDASADVCVTAPPKYPPIVDGCYPEWVVGDSQEVLRDEDAASYDMAFGCPPYYGLEKYSDDPADLSNMTPKAFDSAMAATVAEVARILRPDSFAVFVVGSVRDRHGHILDMRRCMEDAGERAGLALVNDAILLTPVGSAAVRAARSFERTRALARVHQEVLVFVKGNRKRAAVRAGQVELGSISEVLVDD